MRSVCSRKRCAAQVRWSWRSGALHEVPAGGAFAVDREKFSAEITRRVEAHPLIEVVHEVVDRIPEARPLVIATGPLTSGGLADDIASAVGAEHLAYYDAIAPIVSADSINFDLAFRASRYDKGGDGAYVNCPLNEEEYEAFVPSPPRGREGDGARVRGRSILRRLPAHRGDGRQGPQDAFLRLP